MNVICKVVEKLENPFVFRKHCNVVLNEKGCQLKAGVQGFSPATVPCAQGFSVHIYPYTHAYMCN